MSKHEIINEIARLKKDLEMYEKWAQEPGYNQANAFYVPYTKGAIAQLEKELSIKA